MSNDEIVRLDFNQLQRPLYKQQLKDTEWDIIVIGGGITGAGVALEAVSRGLSVALIDQRDFGFGTSSRSTKMAHGGIRYIAQGHLRLVREAITERNWLRDVGLPHLIRPVQFIFPIFRAGRVGDQELPKSKMSYTLLRFGVFLYDLLCGFKNYAKRQSTKDIDKIKEMEPALDPSRIKGAVFWYDTKVDDARLVIETLKEAVRKGHLVALNYIRFIEFEKNVEGCIKGIRVIDEATPNKETFSIRGKVVVNATGVWTDYILGTKDKGEPPIIRPTKGVHLAYHRKDVPVNRAFGLNSMADGRIFFIIPRNEWTIIGTTDTDYSGDPSEAFCNRDDADYLRDTVRFLFPTANIDDSHLLGSYAGLRPLAAEPGKAESEVSRKHVILEHGDGFFSLLGGKLTTFRLMAEELFRKYIHKIRKSVGLPNFSAKKNLTKNAYAIAITQDEWENTPEVKSAQLHPRIVHHLFEQYGRGGLTLLHQVNQNSELGTRLLDISEYPVEVAPWILAEIDYVIQYEAPLHLEDVLCRRMEISWLVHPKYQGHIAALVANRMGNILGWSQSRIHQEIDEYLQYIRKNSFFFEGKIPIPKE